MTQTNLDPLAHSPDRAGVRLGISTRAVYEHIASGELRSFKVGKRRLVTDSECQAFIARREAEAVTSVTASPTESKRSGSPRKTTPAAATTA